MSWVASRMQGGWTGAAWGAVVGGVCAVLVIGLDLAIPLGPPLTEPPLLIGFVALSLVSGAAAGWIAFPQVSRSAAEAIVLYYVTTALCIATLTTVELMVHRSTDVPSPLFVAGYFAVFSLSAGATALIPAAIGWYAITSRRQRGQRLSQR